ncbi:RdRP-domain-containing protein [Imleria badia]|nr:RdRP-domain-containing protein [Imleria badia]
MDIFMRRVALAATEDDVKVELAKILHRAPFQLEPLLNFDVTFFKNHNPRGKVGILTLPTENAGHIFLRSYGTAGVRVKGSNILFSLSDKPLNEEKVKILNSRPWRDPQQLKLEKEQRTREGKPYPLTSYAFGHFLADGTFSSEFVAEGTADIACDLERRMVRFTLRKQGQPSDDDDIVTIMLSLTLHPSTMIVSYPPKSIDSIVESGAAEEPIIFIKANTFPFFATETHFQSAFGDQIDTRRSQGLIPGVPMPPGCFSLVCTFADEDDKEAFVYAAQSRFNLRRTVRHGVVRIRDNTSARHATGPDFDFLSELPFELAFEVEKAITNWTLKFTDSRSLRGELDRLCDTHGAAAAPIFRRFISLLEDEGGNRQTRRRRGQRRNRAAPTTLEERLKHATELYLEEQARPRGRLAPALPSPGVSYSYHMILTPTRYILEGPVADQSNSVLRRFGNHECFLRVSFQDENRSKLRRDLETSITDLLQKRYRPVLLSGCSVAGRRYQMLGYSMSGLKEHSLWFVTPFEDDEGGLLGAEKIRKSLGNFSGLSHQPARLGARWSQAFSATDPSITLELEEIRTIDDIKSPENKVMTDGCSPISTELARAIWRANQRTKKRPARGRTPSAYQFRLGGAKGMVVQDPTLEGRVVCLRPSQVKFEAPDHRTFDIQSTSLRPKSMFLNRPLIVVLEYLGASSERIIELQQRSIDEAQSVQRSFVNASKVLQQHGLGTSFHLPSLLRNMANVLNLKIYDERDRSDEPEGLYNDLIANTLHCAETHILRELKYRAHIAVPGSFTLLGVSDEWDCLAEGEIFATIHDEKTGLYQEITGPVAITRSPQIHPGDVQTVTAVRRRELEHLTNVVVFSCRGNRALSSCLGGGDLDGDDFNLILDPKLVHEENKTPGEYVSLPIKRTEHACGIEDVVAFIFDYIEADLVGQIAISHLRFSDLADPSCDDCLRLAELASQAVDFQKTGTPVKFQDLPRNRNRVKPDFLAREGADLNSDQYYASQKLLGQLFRRVPVKDWIPPEWNETHTPSGGEIVEHALRQIGLYGLGLSLAAPSDELQDEMEHLLDDYCQRLFAIATTHTASKNKDIHVSESELVSGTIMANWSDHHRRREAVGAMNLQVHPRAGACRKSRNAREQRGWTRGRRGSRLHRGRGLGRRGGRLLPGDATDCGNIQAGVGIVVRGGDSAEGRAGVVRAPEFWADRIGADVGACQSGTTAGVIAWKVPCNVEAGSSERAVVTY